MKVFDCFAFFNELEILELRLKELSPVVDYFVLVEATRTFQKQPKQLYFEQNKSRFEAFLPRIIHIKVDHYPHFFNKFRIPTAWDYDNHQKEQILCGLDQASSEDKIIVSDLDEIPDPQKLKENLATPGISVFRQKLFYYYLNCWVVDYEEPIVLSGNYKPWQGSVMLSLSDLRRRRTIKATRNLRDRRPPEVHWIEDGGWHFSYVGGVDRVIKKIEAYAHTEVNKNQFKQYEQVEKLMRSGNDLFGRKIKSQILSRSEPDLANILPRTITKDFSRWQNLWLESEG